MAAEAPVTIFDAESIANYDLNSENNENTSQRFRTAQKFIFK